MSIPLALGFGASAGLAHKHGQPAGIDPQRFLRDYAGFVGNSYKDWGKNIGGLANQVKGAVGDVGEALFPTPYGAEGQLIESNNPLLRSQGQSNLSDNEISDALFPGY